MASISKRPSKSGMTYRIQVKIKDKGSGEIKVHSTTWKPPVGLTPKQLEREVVIFASEYENAIKALETASGEPTQSAETIFSDYALWWLKTRRNIRLNIMTLAYAVGVIFYCPFSKEIL